jgi:hypothetical protein
MHNHTPIFDSQKNADAGHGRHEDARDQPLTQTSSFMHLREKKV